jgi:hypothetical protein
MNGKDLRLEGKPGQATTLPVEAHFPRRNRFPFCPLRFGNFGAPEWVR